LQRDALAGFLRFKAVAGSFLSSATASDAFKQGSAREGEVGGRALVHDRVARDELGRGVLP
jgi:hypothetical protein